MTTVDRGVDLRGLALAMPLRSTRASGTMRRRATAGQGATFFDHAPYQLGDDVRRLDWALHARLGEWMVRRMETEPSATLTLLLDTSLSMRTGTPTKWRAVRRMVDLLVRVAQRRGDAVALHTVGANTITWRGSGDPRGQSRAITAWLDTLTCDDTLPLARALAATARQCHPAPGLVVLLTDGWDDDGSGRWLHCLQTITPAPAIIQCVAYEELAPSVDGTLRVRDSEHPTHATDVAVSDVPAYRARVDAYVARARATCQRAGGAWLTLPSTCPDDRFVREALRAGLLTSTA